MIDVTKPMRLTRMRVAMTQANPRTSLFFTEGIGAAASIVKNVFRLE
jgi:hypothetical protein